MITAMPPVMPPARESFSFPVRRKRRPVLHAAFLQIVFSGALLHGADVAGAAEVSVVYVNATDGFSSDSPADPNSTAPGNTLGQQRKASMEAAAKLGLSPEEAAALGSLSLEGLSPDQAKAAAAAAQAALAMGFCFGRVQ